MCGPTHRSATIERLAQQLARLEQSNRQAQEEGVQRGDRSHGEWQDRNTLHSTGISALDALLPERGIRDGTLVEWLRGGVGGDAGSGAATLSFTAAFHAIQRKERHLEEGERVESRQPDGICIVVDERRVFYPPAAHRLGGDLDRMIVVHPPNARETLWVFEQSLRCSGVAVVVGWIDRIASRDFRRLQLATETGGGMGFLLRPAKCRAEPSWAAARLLVEPLPAGGDRLGDNAKTTSPLHHPGCLQTKIGKSAQTPAAGSLPNGRRLRVVLLHCRGRLNRETQLNREMVELETDDATGDVRLASRLADPADSLRATGA